MEATIAVLPGDGIGPEVTKEAVLLLEDVAAQFGHTLHFQYGAIGGVAYDSHQHPFPEATRALCRASDAVLLGAVGGPKWDGVQADLRPEAGLLALRKTLRVYANVRPIVVWPSLMDASPLKPDVVSGADFVIIRELTGGLYFGQPRGRTADVEGVRVVDTLVYTETEIERIVRKGFEFAYGRRKHLTSVDKANVLESSRLWRETVNRVQLDYPDVAVTHMLVDTAAMQLVTNPRQFDVIVTENLFGDILSDEAAVVSGSIGVLPSASLSDDGPGLFEPIHGSAPDIAGLGFANPLGTFLSAALLLRYGLGLGLEGAAVERAVQSAITRGARTRDLVKPGVDCLTTTAMGAAVREALKGAHEHAENAV